MIDQITRDRIIQMHAAGKNYNEIAERTGAHRTTVAGICERSQRASKHRLKFPELQFKGPGLSGPLVWCGGCRTPVRMPCVACNARRFKAAQRIEP